MIGIHPIHRRMAELHLINKKRKLTDKEMTEMSQCIVANCNLVFKLDQLKQLSFAVYLLGETDWQMEICAQIEKVEAKMI